MLIIKPIHLAAANEFVRKYHRHNLPTVGSKFAISCHNDKGLCGVAICGRPTARKADDGVTLEIYRNCTDGTINACSKLYGACVRIAGDMGYQKVITYILESENGASVKASNFICEGKAGLKKQVGSRQKDHSVAPAEYKKRYAYYIGSRGKTMPIPKTAIEYFKSERAKQTVPYQKFYDEAIAALEREAWISVEDRLPKKYISVLAYMPNQAPCPTVHECYIGEDGKWHSGVVYGVEHEDITHWMPLPEPPKGAGE